MIKCAPRKDGYAETLCEMLLEIAEYHRPGKRSKGLYIGQISNWTTRAVLGRRVSEYQQDHMGGVFVLNFCPFCGGHLRDMSDDAAPAEQTTSETEL